MTPGLNTDTYTLSTNEHGHPQAYDEAGNEICEGCGSLGHVNTGDGTYCADCQDKVMADCRCMCGED